MKTCIKCLNPKDINNFYKNGGSSRHSVCKQCQSSIRGQKVAKPCTQCGTMVTLRIDTSRWINTIDTPLCKGCFKKRLSLRSKAQVGNKNPNWKEGATDEATKFYTSPEWKELRTKVFTRDNYTCRDCPQRGGQLEANHIKARSRFPELVLDIDNIETLCKPCHYKKKWMVYL